ncbi:GAF domain-containing protein [Streptomyces sp. SAJ15]|uniref:GAF domain-containing protein n=1 Tax=Streptomyces sp. SAJ15 TaxID=2011095 RepID=UPI001186C12F|nr:GAF domain-containing protein [Streptomyces sp. SAJ15]TVL93349.1 diguanylate phosphodiesterase [Streptomyces sp. SAJ15]
MDGPLNPEPAERTGPAERTEPAQAAACAERAEPYIELLARGAPAEAFERPVLRARAEGESPARLAALERAKLAALRVHGELEGRRRREAELSALYETAHDLAGLRDLDAVLQAIVQRARSLLGTEVAYLTLNDPRAGDTYMRVTDGSVSARFQQLRLGMGEGLGGLVAQTARPYVTDSYLDDPRFQHTHTIDEGVIDEGLVAILGVPLMLGSGVIGVLFAADRRARVFEREQIALLGSFAAHAAVALDTANLLAETRSALAELEAANEIIRDRSAVIERASEVHDRLTELVLRGGGVHDVAAAVAEVLNGAVEFVEPEACPLAAVDRSRADGRAVRQGDDWIAAVSAGGELLGALVLHGHPGLDPVDQRTLERAAMVTSLLQLARRSAGEAEQRVRGELLDDLLDAPDRDPGLLRERALRLRADLDAPHVVLAARVDTGGDAVDPAAAAPKAPTGAGAGVRGGRPAASPGRAGADSRPVPGARAHGDREAGAPAAGRPSVGGHSTAGRGPADTSDAGRTVSPAPSGGPSGGPGAGPSAGPGAHPSRVPSSTADPRASGRRTSGGPVGGPVGYRRPPGGSAARGATVDRRAVDRQTVDRQRLWSAASHLAATGHGLAAARDGGVVLLLPLAPGENAAATARRAARQLGTAVHAPVTVGASAPVPAPAAAPGAVADAYAEALRCLSVLDLLGRAGEGGAAEDFGFLGLLLAGARDGDRVAEFVHRTIGTVIDYDRRRGTDLVRTLDAYFASGMSPVRTKDALHVHVNTVAQRLERVARLLGPGWQEPSHLLEIQLALRLHRLSAAVAR